MPTRCDMWCPRCHHIQEIIRGMLETPEVECPGCQTIMVAYFGKWKGSDMLLNLGYQENKYKNTVDADIAKFQFKNLG